MNNKQRVRRIRTLQAILRAYKYIYIPHRIGTEKAYSISVPTRIIKPGVVDRFKSIGKHKRWHPRRGGIPKGLNQQFINAVGRSAHYDRSMLITATPISKAFYKDAGIALNYGRSGPLKDFLK